MQSKVIGCDAREGFVIFPLCQFSEGNNRMRSAPPPQNVKFISTILIQRDIFKSFPVSVYDHAFAAESLW